MPGSPRTKAIAKTAGPTEGALAKAMEADMQATMDVATRPLLDSASVFVRELQSTLRHAEGEIDLLNAIDARAADAHRDALDRMESKHTAERLARDRMRAEFTEIAARCKAALGLSDGEGQGQ